MKAPEKSTRPCPPSSTHTWVPSFSQVSVQSRLTVSVSHQASGQQAGHHGTTGSRFPGNGRCAHGPRGRRPWRKPAACPTHTRGRSPGPRPALPRCLPPGVPAPCRDPTHPPHGPPCTALTHRTHHQRAHRRGQGQQAFPRGLQGPFSGKMQELLETSGDGQSGCRLHTQGRDPEGQPRRAHLCGWEAGARAAAASLLESAQGRSQL